MLPKSAGKTNQDTRRPQNLLLFDYVAYAGLARTYQHDLFNNLIVKSALRDLIYKSTRVVAASGTCFLQMRSKSKTTLSVL
jgi:hypothetical protein